MFTVKEIAQETGVREHTVNHWIKTGQLKAANVGVEPGKRIPRYRVKQSDWDAFWNQRAVVADPPLPPKSKRKRVKKKSSRLG